MRNVAQAIRSMGPVLKDSYVRYGIVFFEDLGVGKRRAIKTEATYGLGVVPNLAGQVGTEFK